MQEQAPLLGREAVTSRAIRFQGQLVVVARVFHLATGTGEVPVEHLGAGWLPIWHDTAGVAALFRHCDRDDYPARVRPCSRLVARRVTAGRLSPPTRLGPRGRLDDLVGQRLQHRVAREACDRAQVGVRCAPRPHLGRGTVAVTATDEPGIGPGVPQPLDHPLAHRQHVCPAEACGREDRGEQTPRAAFIQVQRPETLATIIASVAAMVLCTMSAVLSVIAIEHDGLGWTVVGRATLLHQHQSHTGEACAETLFSERESVGCEAKGAPVAGKRLRRSCKRGSWRKVCAAFASS